MGRRGAGRQCYGQGPEVVDEKNVRMLSKLPNFAGSRHYLAIIAV
jgi:hypothetical protein